MRLGRSVVTGSWRCVTVERVRPGLRKPLREAGGAVVETLIQSDHVYSVDKSLRDNTKKMRSTREDLIYV